MNNIEKSSAEWQMSNNPICIGGDNFTDMALQMNVNPAFVAGAEWMQEKMIEKACEVIKSRLFVEELLDGEIIVADSMANSIEELINDFKKAMKE